VLQLVTKKELVEGGRSFGWGTKKELKEGGRSFSWSQKRN
jgi:hypothetical protein